MYQSKSQSKDTDRLFEAVLKLENIEECYRFFDDLCTIQEIKAFSQRFEVAERLKNNETYVDIAEKTGASTSTISRVNKALVYGAEGYELVIKKLKKVK